MRENLSEKGLLLCLSAFRGDHSGGAVLQASHECCMYPSLLFHFDAVPDSRLSALDLRATGGPVHQAHNQAGTGAARATERMEPGPAGSQSRQQAGRRCKITDCVRACVRPAWTPCCLGGYT